MLNLEISDRMLFELISKGLNSTCKVTDISDSPNIGTFILKAENLDDKGPQDGDATIEYKSFANGHIKSTVKLIEG